MPTPSKPTGAGDRLRAFVNRNAATWVAFFVLFYGGAILLFWFLRQPGLAIVTAVLALAVLVVRVVRLVSERSGGGPTSRGDS